MKFKEKLKRLFAKKATSEELNIITEGLLDRLKDIQVIYENIEKLLEVLVEQGQEKTVGESNGNLGDKGDSVNLVVDRNESPEPSFQSTGFCEVLTNPALQPTVNPDPLDEPIKEDLFTITEHSDGSCDLNWGFKHFLWLSGPEKKLEVSTSAKTSKSLRNRYYANRAMELYRQEYLSGELNYFKLDKDGNRINN
jgi:hypothetical protein